MFKVMGEVTGHVFVCLWRDDGMVGDLEKGGGGHGGLGRGFEF